MNVNKYDVVSNFVFEKIVEVNILLISIFKHIEWHFLTKWLTLILNIHKKYQFNVILRDLNVVMLLNDSIELIPKHFGNYRLQFKPMIPKTVPVKSKSP